MNLVFTNALADPAFAVYCAAATIPSQCDVLDIFHKSVDTLQSDWTQCGNYSYVERRIQSKDGASATLNCSPYRRLISVDEKHWRLPGKRRRTAN